MKNYRVYYEYRCPVYKRKIEGCISDLTEANAKQIMEMLKHCAAGHNGLTARSWLEKKVDEC